MIDTKELRRLVKAALAAPDGLSAEWMDRLGQFQEAADASVVSELLDRLEAAEADALEQARLNGMGASREAALLAKLEAAEKTKSDWLRANAPGGWVDDLRAERDDLRARIEEMEKDIALKERIIDSLGSTLNAVANGRDELRAAVCHEADCVEACKAEVETLRAKIEAMEKQEPICRAEDLRHAEILLPSLGLMPEDKLYALPGAKGE